MIILGIRLMYSVISLLHRDRWFTTLIRAMFLLPLLILQGCWSSEVDLIHGAKMDDPFDGARDILLTQEDGIQLISRIGNKNEFEFYMPEGYTDTPLGTLKFHDLTPAWKLLGERSYIMGKSTPINDNKFGYEYHYAIFNDNKVVLLSPQKSTQVTSLSQLINLANRAVENRDYKKKYEATFEISSASQANMAKQLINATYKEEQQKKEEERKKQEELARIQAEEARKQEEALAKRKAAKGFQVCNNADENAFVAFAAFDSGDWTSEGWYKISPGDCRSLAKEIGGKTYYYFAQGDKGGIWNGTYNLCFKPKDIFTIKGFNDCEKRGYKTGMFKQVQVASDVWEHKESLPIQKREETTNKQFSNKQYASKLADLDVGEGVYVQGFFSDELVYVMRIDYQNERVKVQRAVDGTAKWVSAGSIISREESSINDVGRAAVTIGVFYCLFNPDACKQ